MDQQPQQTTWLVHRGATLQARTFQAMRVNSHLCLCLQDGGAGAGMFYGAGNLEDLLPDVPMPESEAEEASPGRSDAAGISNEGVARAMKRTQQQELLATQSPSPSLHILPQSNVQASNPVPAS